MKGLIALAVTTTIASQAVVSFAGPPEPKQVVPVPPPPPVSYFRPNEFDIGIFGTYVTGTSGGGSRTRTFANGDVVTISTPDSPDAWGGGMDFTYFFAWKYLGIRFQGAGVALSSQTVTGSITGPNNSFHFSRSNSTSGGAAAGIITGDIILRLPLDDFWPNVHLAPYIIGGGGGVFSGAGGNTIHTRFPELNQEFNNASSNVDNDRGLGHIGGGFEYRFTPHIGFFGEATYNWVAGGQHNFNSSVKDFIQSNFGFRYAF